MADDAREAGRSDRDGEPGETDGVLSPEIAGLLDRRDTLLQWLERLEERREEVRPEVHERVRSDYRERLTEVERNLSGHRREVETTLESRRAAAEAMDEEREAVAARLEELGLRHEVGELSDEAWEEARTEHEAALEELEERLGEERSAVARLSGVRRELETLAKASPEAAGGWEEAARADPYAGSPPPEGPEGERVEAAAVDDDEKGTAGATGPGFPDADSRGTATSGPASEPAAEEPEAGRYDDELEFLESLSLDDPDALDTLSLDLGEDDGEEPDASEEERTSGKESGSGAEGSGEGGAGPGRGGRAGG